MATKIIKFHDNNTTYVPVTLAKAVQFTYNTNQAMSVQEAIEQVAGSALSISSSVTSNATAIATHVGTNDIDFSYTSGTGVKISGVHTAKTKILKGEGLTYIKESGNDIIIGTTATNNTGTVTKVSTTGAISGGDITTTGTISHVKQGPSKTGNTNVQQNSVNGTLSEGKSFKVAKLTINEYGHVTAATDVTYTMPSSFTPSAHDHTMTLSGSADTTAQANNLVSVIKTLPSTLTTANSNAYTTYTVPTKEYVDTKVADMTKALKYQGTISAGATAFPTGAQKGDVYVFAGTSTIGTETYEKGDMAIYDGTNWTVVNTNWTAVDGTAALDWGQTTTLATIGGVTIDATMPAKPVLTTKKTGTGNVVTYVNATADHELTYYMGLTAVTTLSGTANNGVLTNLTQSGATITVTSQNNTVTDANATKASTDTTLGTSTTYVVTSVTENASGKITVTKTGIKIPAASNVFSALTALADASTETGAGTSNTGSASAEVVGDTINFKGGNKWITTGVTDTSNNDTVIINHAINSTSFAKTTADVYSIKIDNAGHITEATAAATGTVGINSLSYSVSSASVDEFILFNDTWGTANNVAALTGNTTFVK